MPNWVSVQPHFTRCRRARTADRIIHEVRCASGAPRQQQYTMEEGVSRLEREKLMLPLQRLLAPFDDVSVMLGHSIAGEVLLPLFATLFWCLDAFKCNAGVWLIPVTEIMNGLVKWATRRGRPCWVDPRRAAKFHERTREVGMG
jgi:hypothetical protein